MTSPASAILLIEPRRRGGFTLTELLVAIGVLVLLVGLTTIAVTRTRRAASSSRVKADFQAISMALEAFRQDHGEYPGIKRIPAVPGHSVNPADDSFRFWKHNSLALCLIAPGQAEQDPVMDGRNTPSPNAPMRHPQTGHYYDGGKAETFRTTWGSKIWPAYLSSEKFKLQRNPGRDNAMNTDDDTIDIVDIFGGPIQYYPRRNSRAIDLVTPANTPVDTVTTIEKYDGRSGALDVRELQLLLGESDISPNAIDNRIANEEQVATDAPYILISLGDDKKPLDFKDIQVGYMRKVFLARDKAVPILAGAASGEFRANDNVYSTEE